MSNEHLHKARKKRNDEWFEIPGHSNYFIKENGDIFFQGCQGKRVYRKPKMIQKTINKVGYYIVHLDAKVYLLHRLLAQTFIPNPENKPEIDHADGNPQNNELSNLRWATHKENLNNPVSVKREIDSHTGLESNIKGRKKVWIDKNNKIYRMVKQNEE